MWRILIAAGMVFMTTSLTLKAFEATYTGSVEAGLHSPISVAVHDDWLAVLEPYSNEFKVFSPEGLISKRVHLSGRVSGLTRLSTDLFLYCDRSRGVIVAVDVTSGGQYDFLGPEGRFEDPVDMRIEGNTLYVLDAGNSSLMTFDVSGVQVNQITLTDENGESLRYAAAFDIDTSSSRILVLDQVKARVCVYDRSGVFITSFGSFGSGEAGISRGGDICVVSNGHVLVSDRYQGRIAVFDGDGDFVDFIDSETAESPDLHIPVGIAADETGLVYVVSSMRPAIDIYHVDFGATTLKAMTSGQQYPEDRATLRQGEIELAAYAEAENVSELVRGFHFEIYRDRGTQNLLEASGLISPSGPVIPGITADVITGSWRPGKELDGDSTYYWRSRVETIDTISDWTSLRSFVVLDLPQDFHLHQNFPNPFNPETRMSFELPQTAEITLEVFSLLGRRVKIVAQGKYDAGSHTVLWNSRDETGTSVASGVYFYRLSADSFSATRKMMLVR
jgi:DNA-binding beta-propeller fold protein YncE